jgi:hypothetical protein
LDKKEIFEADTWKRIFNRNVFERLDLHNALIEYSLLSINEAVQSEKPIQREVSYYKELKGGASRKCEFTTLRKLQY